MERWHLVGLGGVALVVVLIVWGVPAFKGFFVSSSTQVTVQVTSAEDDYEVDAGNGTTVSKTVIGMVVEFPMGNAPDNISDLKITDENGNELTVYWEQPDRSDDDEKRVTRWTFRSVYLPIGFRQGKLRNEFRELALIRLGNVTKRSVDP